MPPGSRARAAFEISALTSWRVAAFVIRVVTA
jgi:hypothetical protein